MRWCFVVSLVVVGCGRDNGPPPPSASVVQPEHPTDHATERASDRARLAASPLRGVTVTDVAGNSIALADRQKDITVLAFWASWCGPCQAEMPLVDRYAASEHDSRITVIAVNIDENRAEGADAVRSRHYALPVVFDPDEHTYEALFHTQDAEIPAIAVISADGVDKENGFDDDLTEAQHIAHLRDLAHAHLR